MVKSDTIARTIVLAIALINQILAVLGKGTLDMCESDIYQLCSIVATVITAGVTWWKNQSFTQAAITADELLDQLKNSE